jgi:hypothetical protein
MKRLAFLITLMMAGSALAQQPEEVIPDGKIALSIGQSKIFRLDEPLNRIDVISKGIVEATAQSDHQFSIVGTEAGATQLFVFSPEGKRLYSATVTVSPEPGHRVRIYGVGKNDDINAGFVSVYCNDVWCGRPDRDLPTPNVTVERVSRGPKDR